MASDAAHIAGRVVVNFAAQGLAGHRIDFRGRDAGAEGRSRKKRRFQHAERLVEIFARVFVERLAGEPVDDFTEQDEVDVAVNEFDAGWARGLVDQGALDAGFVTAPGGLQV